MITSYSAHSSSQEDPLKQSLNNFNNNRLTTVLKALGAATFLFLFGFAIYANFNYARNADKSSAAGPISYPNGTPCPASYPCPSKTPVVTIKPCPASYPTCASATPRATVTPTPKPTVSVKPTATPTTTFTSISATLASSSATFKFRPPTNITTDLYRVDLSTRADMSWDVYVNFAEGKSPTTAQTIVQANPRKWDKYACGNTLYWRVYNNQRTISSPIYSAKVTCVNTPTRRIGASNDDLVLTGQNVFDNGINLKLVKTSSTPNTIGLRFTNVRVPKNAKIVSAKILFAAQNNSTTWNNVSIVSELADNAAAFTFSPTTFSSRVKSSAVNWINILNWRYGLNYYTPELVNIVQPIVNRPGWVIGNAMSFQIKGSADLQAWSFNGDPAKAPLLRISYEN